MQYVVGEAPRVGRRMRKPQHAFHIRSRAFQIQPIMIAPVLAGETLKNLLFQSRVVSDPVKNPLIGWWQEYYFFYTKLSDLDWFAGNSTDLVGDNPGPYVKMLLGDPDWSPSGYEDGTGATWLYTVAASQRFNQNILDKITVEYFRDDLSDGGTSSSPLLDDIPLAMLNNTGVHDSLVLNDNYNLVDPDVNVDLLGDATDHDLRIKEIDDALNRWKLAKVNGLTDATFEDYLASFGIGSPKAEKPHRSELIRYSRTWQYPSNTVEPTTGVPSSALSWSVQERADKDRFFREPGFITGYSVTRPKVYLSKQSAHIAGFLDRAEDWMPAWLWGQPNTSMKKYAQGTGPFAILSDADGYWVDMRDLYMHGDQYVNFALTETDAGLVAVPTAAGVKKFPVDADIDGLFVTPATKQFIRQDGVVNLTIASTLRDTTPTT